MFRIPYLNPALSHNSLENKEKGLLEIEQSSNPCEDITFSGE